MKAEKFDGLDLTTSIDTLQINSPVIASIDELPDGLSCYAKKKKTGEYSYRYKLNPDKYNNGGVYTMTKLGAVMADVAEKTGLDVSNTVRFDFRFDSSTLNYESLLKLNKVLLLCLSTKYRMKNRYGSDDLLTAWPLSARVQNNRIEAEYYNKAEQEPGGNTTVRLELRSKNLEAGTGPRECAERWKIRLSELPLYYQDVQNVTNEALLEHWKCEKDEHGMTISKFLFEYRRYLYTRNQVVCLVKKIGVGNPVKVAKNFKDRTSIEFISMTDLRRYVEILCKDMDKFLES